MKFVGNNMERGAGRGGGMRGGAGGRGRGRGRDANPNGDKDDDMDIFDDQGDASLIPQASNTVGVEESPEKIQERK